MSYDLRRAYGHPDEWDVPSRNRPDSNQPGALMDPTPSLIGDYVRAIRESEGPNDYYSPEPHMHYDQSNQPYE